MEPRTLCRSLPGPFCNQRVLKAVLFLQKNNDKTGEARHEFDSFEPLLTADLLFISVRRRAPKKEYMNLIRKWIKDGKPIVGIRTSSHAFYPRGKDKTPPGHSDWPTFDLDLLGTVYTGHYGRKSPCFIWVEEKSIKHPVLAGVDIKGKVHVQSSLYKSTKLDPQAEVLLWGEIKEQKTKEPVAWTITRGRQRTFYTSLGGVDDMKMPAIRKLLRNAVFWAL